MYTVICYTKDKKMVNLSYTTREEAMLGAQVFFNSGDYDKVRVFDMAMCLIYSIQEGYYEEGTFRKITRNIR